MADRYEAVIVDLDDLPEVGVPLCGRPAGPWPASGTDRPRARGAVLDALRWMLSEGMRAAAITAGRDAPALLASAGAADVFAACLDGADRARLRLADFPDPASLAEAARRLGVSPGTCAVVSGRPEAARAARQGGFGLVVGVAPPAAAEALRQAGADVVVGRLVELPASVLCAAADPWVLAYRGFDPGTETTRETLLTVGNGYFATRGSMTQATAGDAHYPGTYVAGVYNRLTSRVGGREREDESIVNVPNWLALTFRAGGDEWVTTANAGLAGHRVALDLRRGMLTREVTVVDGAGRRTRVTERRVVSMADPHLGALEVRLTPQNWSGRLEVRSVLDGRVTNDNVAAYRGLASTHLELVDRRYGGPVAVMVARTTRSRIRVAVAARTTALRSGGEPAATARPVDAEGVVGHEFSIGVTAGEEILVEKAVGIATSRDRGISEPGEAAARTAAEAASFPQILEEHARWWQDLWRRFRIGLDGNPAEAQAAHIQLAHLVQTLSPHTTDLDAGVPARGLHGEAYRGHVFWDELFVFPLLDYRLPELTRSLLLYRWRRLPQARRRAEEMGCRGALFPWQSGSDGREETPAQLFNPRSGRWMADHSRRQYHVNLAIAYNVWQHWQVTADLGFLVRHGAELLVDTARLFASLATYDPSTERYDIRGIMGPDEFHDGYPGRPGEGIDNNGYVNVMVAWVLARAREVHAMLGEELGAELWHRLDLAGWEVEHWDAVSRSLTVPFLRNGLLAQFEGYDDLEELDWPRYREVYGDVGRLDLILEAEGDSTNRYQVSKQADVLMLFYLLSAEELEATLRRLGYDFDTFSIPRTVEHYLARTTHGSTLSRIAHAWVLARTDRARSWALLRQALATDLGDTRGGTTNRGVHLGAMAGSVDLLERCYTGLDTHGDVLRFNPLLPDEVPTLDLLLRYRNQVVSVRLDHRRLSLSAAAGPAAPITVAVRGDTRRLSAGESVTFRLRSRERPRNRVAGGSRPGPPREGHGDEPAKVVER